MNMQNQPVTDWENREVKGHALCHDQLVEAHVKKVDDLRAQQKVYLDGLPTDSGEAISEALKAIHPGAERYPDGFEESLHLSFLLEEVLRRGDLDTSVHLQEAATYAATRSADALLRVQKSLDYVSDVLGKAHQANRERG